MMKKSCYLLALASIVGFSTGCEKTLEQERQDVREEYREGQEEIQKEKADVQAEREEAAEEIRDEAKDVQTTPPLDTSDTSAN
jgi:gas vesicle protein